MWPRFKLIKQLGAAFRIQYIQTAMSGTDVQIEIVDKRDGPIAIVRSCNHDLPVLYYRVDMDGHFIEVDGVPDSEDEDMDTSGDVDGVADEEEEEEGEESYDQSGEGGIGGGGGGYTIDRISQRIIRKFQVTGSEYRLTLDEMSNLSYLDAIQVFHRTLTGK